MKGINILICPKIPPPPLGAAPEVCAYAHSNIVVSLFL
jgi:hypothetical protein